MLCLSSVSYSFKLNGKIDGNIVPSRGLRQGDPLSPYLFLLCAEAFSGLLAKAANEGYIHGARVCRTAPRISHLFFADDSILFTRATLQECSKVADILSTYERASGQKINFNKSEVSFSKRVDADRRKEIKELFGVREVDRHEKYLGLPTVIGRSKKMVFGVLKERVWKKLQGWKEKLLSRAGKEILLQSVIQSIPTYMMSLFAIPAGILDDINAMCARFWWGARGTERKMHWLSWEKLCLPKTYGGMGFRDLKIFNQALLAKQGWRLMCDTTSLVHLVMSARYYCNSSFRHALRGFDPSFIWRSIWGAKSLLLEGLKWRVGDGTRIGVWDDSWLPGESSSVVATPNIESPADLKVSDLLNGVGDWCEAALQMHLTVEDAVLARQIPLSTRSTEDVLYWWPNTDGIYTTKSGYWMGRLGHLRGWLARFGGAVSDIWKSVWHIGGPPKLSHFLWRACTGSLATRGQLFARHIVSDACCLHCGHVNETIIHTIFRCSLVSPIWDFSPFSQVILDAPDSSFREFFVWIKEKLEAPDFLTFMATAWGAWSYRNSVLHDEPWTNRDVGVAGFIRLVQEYQRYDRAVQGSGVIVGSVRSRSGWTAPREECWRINTDAAVMEGVGIGLGVVVRDSGGNIVLAAVRRMEVPWPASLAEAAAGRFGLQVARFHGFQVVELETDALSLSKAVAARRWGRAPLDLIIEDICLLGAEFSSFECFHVKRGGNSVAHLMARHLPMTGREQIFVENFPPGILALAELDVS